MRNFLTCFYLFAASNQSNSGRKRCGRLCAHRRCRRRAVPDEDRGGSDRGPRSRVRKLGFGCASSHLASRGQFHRHRCRVNEVAPGPICSPLLPSTMSEGASQNSARPDRLSTRQRRWPRCSIGRLVRPFDRPLGCSEAEAAPARWFRGRAAALCPPEDSRLLVALTRPSGTDRAPYLAALVASSWIIRLKANAGSCGSRMSAMKRLR